MKRLFASVLALAMVISLAACGGSTGSSSSGASTASTGGDQSTSGSTSSGALRIVLSTNDGSTTDDRVPTPWMNHNMATNLMYRALIMADSTLDNYTPDLAEVTVSDDGLVYTITMKDGLKWSDGEDLTADDVIWSIDMVKQAARRNGIYSAAFEKIADTAVDGNVITLTLSEPYSMMMYTISQFFILPKHCLEGESGDSIDTAAYWSDPVTSGYYKVGEFNVGNYFTLVPNEYYEGTAPKIEKVTVAFVTDFLTSAQSGSADFLYGNATELVEGMAALSNYTTFEVESLFYKYFIFNMSGVDGNQNEAMQPLAVRQALIKAIDRAQIAALYPNGTMINSGVPNEHEAYNGFEYVYDAEAAKAELAASGYDMSRTLKICYYNNDQTSIDLINMVVYYLEQAGLKVEATLSNDGTTDLFTTRNYDIGFKGYSASRLDEWYSEYLSTSATFANIFGGDDRFDAPIAALNAATNNEARNAALQTLQEMEQENMWKVPLFTLSNYVFVSDNVVLPSDASFCNPLYVCDVDYVNWTLK